MQRYDLAPAATSARPPNTPNSIVQFAGGRIVGGLPFVLARLAFAPYPGNDLICIYSGNNVVAPPGWTQLLGQVSDAGYQTMGISVLTADITSIGVIPQSSSGDNSNWALYEVNGLKTRTVAHGAPSVSGNVISVPYPAAPTGSWNLLQVETDNGVYPTAMSAGLLLDGGFGCRETGGNHAAAQYRFAGTGAAGTATITMTGAPYSAVCALLNLAP